MKMTAGLSMAGAWRPCGRGGPGECNAMTAPAAINGVAEHGMLPLISWEPWRCCLGYFRDSVSSAVIPGDQRAGYSGLA
jgi:hypothetical protein